MSESSARLRCTVLTPESKVLEATAYEVVLPADDGLLGVLPDHAPLLCSLGNGLLRYVDSEKRRRSCYIERGFGHIRDNEVTILAERTVNAEQITTARAQEMLLEAQTMSTETIEEVELRTAAIKRAKDLIRLAEGTA